jgi:hypothetical protein
MVPFAHRDVVEPRWDVFIEVEVPLLAVGELAVSDGEEGTVDEHVDSAVIGLLNRSLLAKQLTALLDEIHTLY